MSILKSESIISCDQCDNYRKQKWSICPRCRQDLTSPHEFEQENLKKIMEFSLDQNELTATINKNMFDSHANSGCSFTTGSFSVYLNISNKNVYSSFRIEYVKHKIIWDLIIGKLDKFIKEYDIAEIRGGFWNSILNTYQKIGESVKDITSKIFCLKVDTYTKTQKIQSIILLFTQKELEDQFPVLQKIDWIYDNLKIENIPNLYDMYKFIYLYRELICNNWYDYYVPKA